MTTKTIKLPPLVIDQKTSELIHRLADGDNVSNLLREWIKTGVQAHPRFSTGDNIDNLTADQICVINKHGRPRNPKGVPGATGVTGVSGPTPATTPAVVRATATGSTEKDTVVAGDQVAYTPTVT